MKPKINKTIVSIGEVLWDNLPSGRQLGGASANFIYHAACQGANAVLVSAVGNDQDGDDILARFQKDGLSTELIARTSEAPTGTVEVELKDNAPSYKISRTAAWDYIPWTEALANLAANADAVCFGSLAQRSPVSAETIQKFLHAAPASCLKIFDVNLRETYYSRDILKKSMMLCDILKISQEELPACIKLLGVPFENERKIMDAMLRHFHMDSIILTRGSKGSLRYDGKVYEEIPVISYGHSADTVGCGDSFTASYCVAILAGKTHSHAMRYASEIAGWVASLPGGTPDYGTCPVKVI